MKKRYYLAVNLLTVTLIFGSVNVMAQKDTDKLKQEVEVTKAYQPTISEAVKIIDIPEVKAEQTETPTFDYSIYSKPVFLTFDVTPVAAAKMVGEPKPEMGMGLLKLGLGNYITPYGELFFNAQPDKKSNFGMHFRHLSSYGKINLLNDDRVKAPEAENSFEVFGKRFFRNSTLSGSLAFDRKSFNYYGYTGDMLSDDLKEQMIPYFEDKQYFSKGTGSVNLKSETNSAYDLSYDFGFKSHYFVSKTGQTENQTRLSIDLGKKFDNAFGILNASVTHYMADSILNRFSNTYGSKQQLILRINPSAKWSTDNASVQAGLNTSFVFDDDIDASLFIWPKVKAEWSPVERVLTLFAGIDGHLQHNTYSSIAAENPYVDPYHDVANANYKYILSGGFKGKLSPITNYVAEVSYSKVKNQHFYVTEAKNLQNLSASNRRLSNTFSWVYDDLNVMKISGEILHSVSDNFSLHLLGNYYSYDLKSLQEAWQMPNFDLTFSGIYQPAGPFTFSTDIYVIGKRKALISEPLASSLPSSVVEMDPIIDLNVGAEYQFSDRFNFFVNLNNFGFQNYEQWLGYTNKSFNWLAGISYSF
ncbi:MAG TPA: hypothetical protein VFC65_08000 [Prolixibacteraceae bacterium]|nr:hypothetical protein [Prolixibacteraceae bacterium]